jgi:oligopeptidase B
MNEIFIRESLLPAPITAKYPQEKTVHGVKLIDDYAWLKAPNWREVLRDPAALPANIRAVIEAENQYAEAMLVKDAPLRELLVKEMRGRIQEDDVQVPRQDGPWAYYTRYDEGGQQPIFCRKASLDGFEDVLLNGDLEAKGKGFFDIGAVCHAPDHQKLAWSYDDKGSEYYSIKILDLATKAETAEIIGETDGSIVWLSNSDGFYYVRVDANHRTAQVFRHILGTEPTSDKLVFEELDPRWFVHIRRSQSKAYAIISVSDHDASENHLLALDSADAKPRLVEPRAPGFLYDLEHRGERLYIRTNADGAEDFKIVSVDTGSPAKAFWVDETPHQPGRMIVTATIFEDYLVRLERQAGLPKIVIRQFSSGEEHAISFAEEAYQLGLESRLEFEGTNLRFSYSSMTTPREIYDYDLATRERVLRKRQSIPSGHDPSLYKTRRLFAPAKDGESIPISLLYRADLALDGSAPLLLYGYGAYGTTIPAGFSSNRLSLVDRGFIYAIAHIRGGTDKGWHWYTQGKLANKPNTFSDFIAAAEYLIGENLTKPGRIIAEGGSAGGMLMGAIANLAPELFAAVIADVPFVDVLNTMLDDELPLTPPEWLEWGNPIADAAAFATIKAYSPYDNVGSKTYPPILAVGGLTDPRVTYWEPLKWVARLRATMTGGGPVLLKTNMGAGHGGASGRFDRLHEVAYEYAFALRACSEKPA